MIYIASFLRRLKLKSSLYFALPPSLALGLVFLSFELIALFFLGFFILLYTLSNLVVFFDRRRITHIECKICHHKHCVLLYPQKKRKGTQGKGSFACSSFDHGHYPDIYFCPMCKNGFLASVMGPCYQNTLKEGHDFYAEVEDEVYIDNIKSRLLTYRKIVEKYRSFFKDRDVLEVGSYYGVFYQEVRKLAKSYQGIEPSTHACRYLRKKYSDINCLNDNMEGVLKKNSLEGKKFDVIVLWDVMEHLPDPVASLEQINGLLKKNGHVLFSTINIEASISLLLGPHWPWFMDMHYYYFSDRGYVNMLKQTGFKLKFHSHFQYYVHFSYFLKKIKSLLNLNFSMGDMDKMDFLVPIRLGDTVLIGGEKIIEQGLPLPKNIHKEQFKPVDCTPM